MNKVIPILLWTLVVVFGGITLAYNNWKSKDSPMVVSPESDRGSHDDADPGAVYAQIPWKHFQDVKPFEMTNQEGELFDSKSLNGRPYVVSFFFSSCPTICKDLNRQMQRLREQVNDEELAFVSISVDPDTDTPETLKRYAADFDADVSNWLFLTGEEYKFREVGEQSFRVIVDKFTHTDNILLVDRWGRFRDRFKWDDPYDMKRFRNVVKDVLAEQEPPLDQTFETRNMMAQAIPEFGTIKWIRDFHLTDQNDQPFFSRDLTGEVWIGSFFFTSCPGICPKQNEYLAGLQKRLEEHPAKLVSITTRADEDTPAVLRDYASQLNADVEQWKFLTGNKTHIKRISAEFFGAHASDGHHSSRLFVVDRWGQVRGDFDWQKAEDEVKMLALIDELNAETVPVVVK